MVAVRVQLNGPVKELPECGVHSVIVLRRHYVMVVLPVLNLLQVLFEHNRLFDVLSDILNQPTRSEPLHAYLSF